MKKTNFAKLVFPFLLVIFLLTAFSAPAAHAQEIPKLTTYVNDFANVIDSSYEAAINAYAAELEANTTAEIAVLTVDTTELMSIEEYTVRVFEETGIGQKGKDNGILIVAAIQDRKWRIEVGYGLEGIINDAKAGRIGREYMTTYFREEKYGEGLYLTVQTLGDIIAGDAELSAQFDEPGFDSRILWIIVAVIILAVLIPVMIIIAIFVKSRRCPKCSGWMRVEHKKDKVCYICKKCGYKKCYKRKDRPLFFIFAGSGSRWRSGRGGGGGWGGGGGGFGGGGSGGGGASGGW